ncbi:MAG: TetR/AcrR family transcriptional regulator [Micromonosporaceae bacterium]|jgi:AcrR family transcriptional regulator|nr:TetR/AcrR family transcriptional regulator [Micromonosporaceae bacterium]
MGREHAGVRRRLSRDDWADAALAAIAQGGLAAVAVEPLAVRLGTTKGSFYWHFPNREALLEAALDRWKERYTSAVNAEVEAASTDPVKQLRLLIHRVVETAERDPIGLALLSNADHPAVARALAQVTEQRIDFIARLFVKMGFTPASARQRALLAYSAYLGHAQLAHSTPQLLPASPAARRAYLDHAVSTLTLR